MADLTRQDMMEAITAGVSRSLHDTYGVATCDVLREAIEQGISDGILRVAKNGSDMPGADFFEMIKQGIALGIEAMAKQQR